jgi:molybdate transport system permease protein
VLGLPVAYLLATREFPGKRVVEVVIDLPMVLPPTVAGFALLMAFGRMGLAGRTLSALGMTLPFTTAGVVVAQVFMAIPFLVGPARAGFAAVDRRLLDVAATLRAAEGFTFFRVALPLALPSILAGTAMSCARALGEFGATITFAGNLPGTTQTMPLAVYIALQSDLDAAVALSVLLLIMAFGLLIGLRSAPAGWFWNSRAPRPGR